MKIDVWKITITGEKSGYLEKEPKDLIDMLQDMTDGDSYTITKCKIDEEEYNLLPEFMGF